MSSVQDLERRVTKVEGELIRVREEQAEVRTLAAGASQDASDYHAALRGHKASLEAVRETQLEHSAALKKLGERQDAHFAELGITQLDQFNHLRVLSTQLQAVSDQVEKLRATQLEHYAEHKADFASLKGDVRTLQGDVSSLKGDVSSLKGDVSSLKSDVRTLKGDVSSLRGDLAVVKDDVAEIKVGMTRIVQAVEKLSGGSAERGTGQ